MNRQNINSLYINQLRLIDALSKTGNLSTAAEQIDLSQSAASHALNRIREAFDDPLFIRTPTGMRPTPYGAQLAIRVSESLLALDKHLEQHPEFTPKESTRTFTLIMNDIGQMLYLPKLLERIATEAPGITIHVRPAPLEAPHALLASGEADLAVGTFTRVVSGCRQRLLHREHYVCVVRRGHPLLDTGMTIETFQQSEHVATDPRGFVHENFDKLLAQHGIVRHVKLAVPYLISLPSVISTSNLVATMSSEVADIFASIAPLEILPLPVELPNYSIRLFWHERYHLDPGNIWLRDQYLDLFRR